MREGSGSSQEDEQISVFRTDDERNRFVESRLRGSAAEHSVIRGSRGLQNSNRLEGPTSTSDPTEYDHVLQTTHITVLTSFLAGSLKCSGRRTGTEGRAVDDRWTGKFQFLGVTEFSLRSGRRQKQEPPPTREDHEAKFYNDYRRVADQYDKEFLKKYDEDLNTTLIFVSSARPPSPNSW